MRRKIALEHIRDFVDKIKNNIKNKEKNRDEDDEIINDEYHAIECFFSD